jgi:hypothetical protein
MEWLNRLNVRDKLRLQTVKRWHIVPTVKEQTVADHVYGVLQIGTHIAQKLGLDILDAFFVEVLQHDVEEVITGDAPSGSRPGLPKSEFMAVVDVLESLHWLRQYGVRCDQVSHVEKALGNALCEACSRLDAKFGLDRFRSQSVCYQMLGLSQHFLGDFNVSAIPDGSDVVAEA